MVEYLFLKKQRAKLRLPTLKLTPYSQFFVLFCYITVSFDRRGRTAADSLVNHIY